MSFSDEDIIAFLLGEADDSMIASLQECMAKDADLVARVNHFRALLTHLDETDELYEPPSGLVETTMQRMSGIQSPSDDTVGSKAGPLSAATDVRASWAGGRTRGLLSNFAGWNLTFVGKQNSWVDSLALTISLIALCCLLLPAMLNFRSESRRLQCAENLRINGQALIQFAIHSPDRRFPAVAQSGPEAFSGIYAVRLGSVGLLDSTSQLFCAGLPKVDNAVSRRLSRLPSVEELHTATPYHLSQWKKLLGGDYAYNLGIIERHGLVAPKNNGSSHFAILADSPGVSQSGPALSGSSLSGSLVPAHDGRGANILYDDGHVQFICRKRLERPELMEDHPFYNRLGDQEAGLDEQDASLAPSFFPPLSR